MPWLVANDTGEERSMSTRPATRLVISGANPRCPADHPLRGAAAQPDR
jgi:hypothetical protein